MFDEVCSILEHLVDLEQQRQARLAALATQQQQHDLIQHAHQVAGTCGTQSAAAAQAGRDPAAGPLTAAAAATAAPG